MRGPAGTQSASLTPAHNRKTSRGRHVKRIREIPSGPPCGQHLGGERQWRNCDLSCCIVGLGRVNWRLTVWRGGRVA
jgi:hypothetical protein